MNDLEKLVTDITSKANVEALQNLQAFAVLLFPEEYQAQALECLSNLTNRDLIFYLLGKGVGIKQAEDAICSHLGKEEQS
jgi:hypothetical protein